MHYAHDQNIMRSSIIKVCVIFNISFEIFAGYYFILMEYLKPFNKLANRVLSAYGLVVLNLIKHSCSFIKHYLNTLITEH